MKNLILVLFIVAINSLSLVKADSNTDARFETATIEFFHDYLKGYNQFLASDSANDGIEQVVSHFYFPMMQVPNNGAPLAVNNKEQLAKNFTFFVNSLKQQGVKKIVWEKLNIKPLTNNKAMAINIANALDSNDKLMFKFSTLYLLYNSDAAWKINVIHPHAIDKHIHL